MIALGILGAVVLLLMRRSHKNRLARQTGHWLKERQPGLCDAEGYYTDELVHVTAPGDSTLRVCNLNSNYVSRLSEIFQYFSVPLK